MIARTIGLGLLVVSFVLGGCAGRDANPTDVIQTADESLSCTDLKTAMDEQAELAAAAYEADRKQEEKNAVVGAAGAILFLPMLFALEPGDHNMIEAQAHDRRKEHLNNLANQKNC